MSISILGGVAKGFSLAAPNSKSVRPTSVLLKRKFFDSHQSLEGARFYDICAGSGSVGFEALSRGADFVEFVEMSSLALKTIKKNQSALQSKFDLPGEVRVTKSDSLKWLRVFEREDATTVFFFDPPYDNLSLYKEFLTLVKEKCREGKSVCDKLVMEFCRQKSAPENEVQKWFGKPDKIYRQGTSFLYIYDLA